MIKAAFFDIDGTLVSFQTHTIPQDTLSALHALREKGILIFISTGRHRLMLERVTSLFDFDGFITLNGQFCFCGDEVLRSMPLDKGDVKELVALAKDGAFSTIFLERDRMYINMENEYTGEFMDNLALGMPPILPPETALEGEVYQAVTFLTEEREHLLKSRVSRLEALRWHPHFIDAIAKGGGKDKGMDVMAARFGFSMAECVAFGDGENDITMLEHAGTGVAMGNAHDAVKERADYVTAHVDDGGIIKGLRGLGIL